MKRIKPTTVQLQQFWNHNIHPITGHRLNKSDFYSKGEKVERAFNNKLKKKYNKE